MLYHILNIGMSRAKLIESTKSRPAKFFTNDQAEIKRMTIEAYNNGVQSVKNQSSKMRIEQKKGKPHHICVLKVLLQQMDYQPFMVILSPRQNIKNILQ